MKIEAMYCQMGSRNKSGNVDLMGQTTYDKMLMFGGVCSFNDFH